MAKETPPSLAKHFASQGIARCSPQHRDAHASPATWKAPASVVPAIAQGNPNRVPAKYRRALRRTPCVQENLQSNCRLPRCNANVELRPKEIERAERAHTSSAVCSNNCYTVEHGSRGAFSPDRRLAFGGAVQGTDEATRHLRNAWRKRRRPPSPSISRVRASRVVRPSTVTRTHLPQRGKRRRR